MKRLKQLLKPENNQTCNKNVKEYECYFNCKTCNVVDDAMYCQKCFYSGNHIDHDWTCIKNVEGVCDCGDMSALKQGCFTHTINSDEVQWNLMFENYTDLELNEIYKIILSNMKNQTLFTFISGHRVLIEIFFFIYLTKADILQLKNFNKAINIILMSDQDTLIEDVLYNQQFHDIIVDSLLIRRVFLFKLSKFLPNLYVRHTDFFSSLNSCQFLQSAYGFQYLVDTQFFKDILIFQSKFFQDETLITQYEQLFLGSYNKVPQFQYIVRDNLEFMKAFVDFQIQQSISLIAPYNEYPNFDIYLSQLFRQNQVNSSYISPLYKFADACGYEYYKFDQLEFMSSMLSTDVNTISQKYSAIIANLIDYYLEKEYFRIDINLFQFYPSYVPQLMFIKLVSLYNLDVKQFFDQICNQVKTSITKDKLILQLIQQFIRIYWFLTTLNWKIFPRNHDDNQEINNVLLQEVYFMDYFNLMNSFTTRIITLANQNIIQLVDKCLPQFDQDANNYFFVKFILNIIMDKTIPNYEKLVQYFTMQCFTFTEDFAQSIKGLQNCYYDKGLQIQLKFLMGKCNVIKSIVSDTKYQLKMFDELQYFQLLDTQTQIIINYSLMKGQTTLLPQFLHYEEFINYKNLEFIKSNINIEDFIRQSIQEKSPNKDLYYYISLCLLLKLNTNGSQNCTDILNIYSDDHLTLFIGNEVQQLGFKQKITVLQRYSILKDKYQQQSSTLLIQDFQMNRNKKVDENNKQICCACHQIIEEDKAICLYDIYPRTLNLFNLDTLRTCKHLHHQQCVDIGFGCAICPKDNQFYLYHVLKQNSCSSFQKDDQLLNILQQLNVDLQQVYTQFTQLVDQALIQPFAQQDQIRLKMYLKEQLYIMQQLYYQNIIILDNSEIAKVIKKELQFETFVKQIIQIEKFSIVVDLPKSTYYIINLMGTQKCYYCSNQLKHSISTFQCLSCGKFYHHTCLTTILGCDCRSKNSYIIDYTNMTILNYQTEMSFRAPYRSKIGTIASSLEGPESFLDLGLLSHLIFLIITGDIYIQQDDNQLLLRDDQSGSEQYYSDSYEDEDFEM
ncbi:Zinc finger domain-containing protein [Spironucleus salmonicida]|uniref:E3 ubiquitin-protein ligase n=1 Tax=Spironucleus salmonicida TaxID=348837 RepID=V6LMY5_9EUKA|nr:Zinc finger domain-containing protein [Spironucleus salmonicida]|eukprot:EST42079.1 Zinc finger domain-containing protein [Spironucleus salmonicida]